MLKIETNYWEGKQCLENESPWIVPGAAYLLDEMLNKDDYVIEIGTGGSTLFYAKRCGFILGIETDEGWGGQVRGKITSQMYNNTCYRVLNTFKQVKDYFEVDQKLHGVPATVLSVDTVQGYNRSDIFEFLLCKYLHSLRIIVMDNYSEKSLWPNHWCCTESQICEYLGDGWKAKTFDDSHWYGSGTRILVRR